MRYWRKKGSAVAVVRMNVGVSDGDCIAQLEAKNLGINYASSSTSTSDHHYPVINSSCGEGTQLKKKGGEGVDIARKHMDVPRNEG